MIMIPTPESISHKLSPIEQELKDVRTQISNIQNIYLRPMTKDRYPELAQLSEDEIDMLKETLRTREEEILSKICPIDIDEKPRTLHIPELEQRN